MMKRLPLILSAILALWAISGVRVPKDKPDTFASNEWARLPVVSNGRYQPLDSLARNSLLQLRDKQKANLEPWKSWYQRPKTLSADEWLMEMTMNPQVADTRPVFRIDHPELKGLLGLPLDADAAAQTDGKHFSWLQLQPKLEALQGEARRAAPKDAAVQTPFEKAVLKLWRSVGLYMKLQNTTQPQNAGDWNAELGRYITAIEPGRAAAIAQNQGKEYDKAALETLMKDLQRFDAMSQLETPLVVPQEEHPGHDHGTEWLRMNEALMQMARGEPMAPAVSAYAKMGAAFKAGNTTGFNEAVRDYRATLAGPHPKELSKAGSEQIFNYYEPFYKGMIIYTLAGLLALFFWVRPVKWEILRRTAVWITVVGLVVHTAGLIWRMVLEGRPPVTNLYSSAIFIGWGCIGLGLILEAFFKNAIGIVVACVCGFCSLIIAHHLALSGDTMEMMRAVLDTNFWLATHVVIITLGYSSTFVAGFLGILYVLLGFFTRMVNQTVNQKSREELAMAGAAVGGTYGAAAARLGTAGAAQGELVGKSLARMTYGILCFATLFSFVGTVLGGIWADQSWGRFWGWDAKENGALLIVLWNALILHARWGGLVRERGLMNLAIFGNVITAWSWFGVNMLGIGLHSYGFMDAAFNWLLLAVGLCSLLIAMGSLPLTMWASFAKELSVAAARRRAIGLTALALAGCHIYFVIKANTHVATIFFGIELALGFIGLLVAALPGMSSGRGDQLVDANNAKPA